MKLTITIVILIIKIVLHLCDLCRQLCGFDGYQKTFPDLFWFNWGKVYTTGCPF